MKKEVADARRERCSDCYRCECFTGNSLICTKIGSPVVYVSVCPYDRVDTENERK